MMTLSDWKMNMMPQIPSEWRTNIKNRLNDPQDLGKYYETGKLYAGVWYTNLNSYLREVYEAKTYEEQQVVEVQYAQDKPQILNIFNALMNLRVDPLNMTLYRGVPSIYMENYYEGQTFCDPAFSSFSFAINTAMIFSWNRYKDPITGKFVIQDRNTTMPHVFFLQNSPEGVWFGEHRGEYEFLIGPRCLFHIDNIDIVNVQLNTRLVQVKAYHITFLGYDD